MSKYTYNANKNSIEYNGEFVAYLNVIDANKVINLLNQQDKQLKKENQSIQKYELKLCSNGNYYVYCNGVLINAPYISFDKFNKEDAESIVCELNNVSDENEQLKSELQKQSKQYTEGIARIKEENEQLKKENQGIQNKVIRLLDYVEKNEGLGLITRDEIKKWWNGDVE